MMPRERIHQMLPFCPACGFGVKFSDDGTCAACGATCCLPADGEPGHESAAFLSLVTMVECAVEHARTGAALAGLVLPALGELRSLLEQATRNRCKECNEKFLPGAEVTFSMLAEGEGYRNEPCCGPTCAEKNLARRRRERFEALQRAKEGR